MEKRNNINNKETMKYGVLGTGDVARSIASKLVSLGHEVMLGARQVDNKNAIAWAKENGALASHATFADAAHFGERVFLCVKGIYAVEIVEPLGEEPFAGKTVIDQTNPYHYADGHISLDPRWSGTTSLGEDIQKRLSRARVVKTLNYLCSHLMTNPCQLGEQPTGFYCGNDSGAKADVDRLLRNFGWTETMDLGDISMSRYTEMHGAFWPAALNTLENMYFGFKLVK